MSVLLQIAEGWTGLLGPFTLKVNDVPVVLTGFTIELKIRKADGTVVVPGGTITMLNQVTTPGQVTYQPVAADFTFAPGGFLNEQLYKFHWKVTDGAGKIVYFPNGAPDEIGVYRV